VPASARARLRRAARVAGRAWPRARAVGQQEFQAFRALAVGAAAAVAAYGVVYHQLFPRTATRG
jgi:predicted metal-dependent hydrolase